MRHSEVARVGMEGSLPNENSLRHLGAEWHSTQERPRMLEGIQRRTRLRDLDEGLKLTTLSNALGMEQGPSKCLMMQQKRGSTILTSLPPSGESRTLEWDLRGEVLTKGNAILPMPHFSSIHALNKCLLKVYKPAVVLGQETWRRKKVTRSSSWLEILN